MIIKQVGQSTLDAFLEECIHDHIRNIELDIHGEEDYWYEICADFMRQDKFLAFLETDEAKRTLEREILLNLCTLSKYRTDDIEDPDLRLARSVKQLVFNKYATTLQALLDQAWKFKDEEDERIRMEELEAQEGYEEIIRCDNAARARDMQSESRSGCYYMDQYK